MAKEIEVKVKRIKCENCGSVYNNYKHFQSCKICGQEVCDNCSEKVKLYNVDWDNWQDDFLVHKTCRRNHELWKDVYIQAIGYLQDKFYKKLDELNKNYLSENDEYMRKWVDIVKE